jgi:hypothetical protein
VKEEGGEGGGGLRRREVKEEGREGREVKGGTCLGGRAQYQPTQPPSS